MNIQEIKNNMTSGEWVETHQAHIQADNDKGDFICDCGFVNRGDNLIPASANTRAICLAVNNTFGQNINPETVPYIVNMLEGLSTEPKLYPHERYAIEQFLESIKL